MATQHVVLLCPLGLFPAFHTLQVRQLNILSILEPVSPLQTQIFTDLLLIYKMFIRKTVRENVSFENKNCWPSPNH